MSQKITYYMADAFAEKQFAGNPAGVCLLEHEISEELMQNIATENNLAETAFLLKKEDGYHLRWFTPDVEIDLCGHATLATAYIVMNKVERGLKYIELQTMSGVLGVKRDSDNYIMSLPNRMPERIEPVTGMEQALGCKILESYLSRDYVFVVESQQIVQNLKPDIDALRAISQDMAFGIVVTAKGDDCDFVSRYFAPNAGMIEDPVTGSSHSNLIPYWYGKLKKNHMIAKQLSKRGGTLDCTFEGDHVLVGGTAVSYLEGTLYV